MGVVIEIFILYALAICVFSAPPKHALKNECKYNKLEAGTYRCIFPDEQLSFYVDCMVDGTMYIDPGQQSLYHYHKQSGLEMKFVLILSSDYESESDVDIENLPKLRGLIDNEENNLNDANDGRNNENENGDDSTLNGDSLESEELTQTEKKSVNLTAQYIVYGVIIVTALIFALGISLLIYWWCCNNKVNIANNKLLNNSDETQPFLDIRSENTIKKLQQLNGGDNIGTSIGNTLYLQRGNNSNNNNNNSNDIYHDIINGVNDNEDGDDLIAHYGSTTNTQKHGYVAAKYPK